MQKQNTQEQIKQIAKRLARKSVEMVGTDEQSCYLMFKKEIESAFNFIGEQSRRKVIDEIEKMRFGQIDEKFSQVGLTPKQRMAVKKHIRQLRINTLDELLNKLRESTE